MVPRGATTASSTLRFVSRLAVKRYPAFCLLESIGSIVRIKMRVPAGTVTLAFCGAGAANQAGLAFKRADEALPNEFSCRAAKPSSSTTAQTTDFFMFFLSFVTFISFLQRWAEKKRSEDQ